MGRNRKKKARAKTRAAAASTDGGAASGTRFTPLEAKAAGDSAFAAGSFAAAVTAYSQAVDGLSAVPLASATATAAVGGTTRGEAGSAEAVEPGRKVEEGEHGGSSVADTEQLLKAVLCNRAAARLRLGNAQAADALADAKWASKIDPSWAKPLLRQAAAFVALGRFAEAREALTAPCVETACATDTRVASLSKAIAGQLEAAENESPAGADDAAVDADMATLSLPDTVAKLHRRDLDSATLQACTHRLAKLVFSDGHAKREAVALGAVQAVVRGLETNLKDEDATACVVQCIQTLRSLALKNDLVIKGLPSFGILNAMTLTLASTHTHSTEVVEAVLDLLCVACANNEANAAAAKPLSEPLSIVVQGHAQQAAIQRKNMFLTACLQ